MKNEKISRDVLRQNEFKKNLQQESINVYGIIKCYASRKRYKGLVASHIKPYKICVLEGDAEAEFDINNGLLLSSDIDAYFDKYDISFDADGRMIFADNLPTEIKEEFSNYYLDEKIFNEKRREYMKIHRSLFFYKNYCEGKTNNTPVIDNIEIPYYDCGLKVFNNNIIINVDNRWSICSAYKFKQEFIARTNHKFKYAIPSADLAGLFLQNDKYLIDSIPQGFNCPDCVYDLQSQTKCEENSFKLCVTNFNPHDGEPKDFLDLIEGIFNHNKKVINYFRALIKKAAQGQGLSKSIVFYGCSTSALIIFNILKQIFGTYVYEIEKPNALYGASTSSSSIYNCRLLLVNLKNNIPDTVVLDKVLNNTYFPINDLNVDTYTPIYCLNKKDCNVDKVIAIKCYDISSNVIIDNVIKNEGEEILNWFLTVEDVEDIENYEVRETESLSILTALSKWKNDCCEVSDDSRVRTITGVLFDSYIKYATENNLPRFSLKRFSIETNKLFKKRRRNDGVYFMGVCLKK